MSSKNLIAKTKGHAECILDCEQLLKGTTTMEEFRKAWPIGNLPKEKPKAKKYAVVAGALWHVHQTGMETGRGQATLADANYYLDFKRICGEVVFNKEDWE